MSFDAENQTEQLNALRATVRGRVHNVGFRMFVLERANALGLKGTVRNAPDGTVQVFAVGPLVQLQSLLAALQRGPSAARVEHVDTQWQVWSGELPQRFEVTS